MLAPSHLPFVPVTPRPAAPEDNATVDELLLEMQEAGAKPAVRGARPPKMRYSHKAMADMLVANPWMSQNELAVIFGRSHAWVSTIVCSDAFQALLASRREELVDPELRLSLEERFRAVATKSLQVLQEKLSRPTAEVADNLVLRAVELSAKGLGIGGNAPPPPPPDPAEYLPAVAERLMRLQGRMPVPDVSDAKVIDV